MRASNPWSQRSSPCLQWWTFSWGLFIPVEMWSQNRLGWKRLPEVTWPHLVTLMWDASINSPRTKPLVNNSHGSHTPRPVQSDSVLFCPPMLDYWTASLSALEVCACTHTCLCRPLRLISILPCSPSTGHTPETPVDLYIVMFLLQNKIFLWVNFDVRWDCRRLHFLALVCVMVNLMHRLGWASRYTDIWSNILGVLVTEFLDKINI